MNSKIKNILKDEMALKLNGRIWVEAKGVRFLGAGPIELLERISKVGSIRKAAMEMRMSYKKSWELINNLNAHATVPIVVPHAGGEKGGGTKVTDAGLELINYFNELKSKFKLFIEEETNALRKPKS